MDTNTLIALGFIFIIMMGIYIYILDRKYNKLKEYCVDMNDQMNKVVWWRDYLKQRISDLESSSLKNYNDLFGRFNLLAEHLNVKFENQASVRVVEKERNNGHE